MARTQVREASDFDPTQFLDTSSTGDDESSTREEASEEEQETLSQDTTDTDSDDKESNSEDTLDQTQEDTQETESSDDDVAKLKKELENWQNRYKNAEQLIGRHSSELNQLRQLVQKQQQSQPEENDSEFLDKFVANPKKALEEELQRREQSVSQQRQQQEEFVQQNIDYVLKAVPNFEELKTTILEIAKTEDGIANASMQMLEQTLKTDPVLAVQYAKRASLKREIEQLRNKGKSVIKQLATNSKKTPVLKGNSQSSVNKEITDADIRSMSDKELKERLKKFGI